MEGKCKCTYVGGRRGFFSLFSPRGGGKARGRVASDGGRTGKIPRGGGSGEEGIEARTHVPVSKLRGGGK